MADRGGQYGTGVACVDPDRNGVDQIAGVKLSKDAGALRNGDKVKITTTVIRINGLHASNGASTSTTVTYPKEAAAINRAVTVTCRALSLSKDGISPPAT